MSSDLNLQVIEYSKEKAKDEIEIINDSDSNSIQDSSGSSDFVIGAQEGEEDDDIFEE